MEEGGFEMDVLGPLDTEEWGDAHEEETSFTDDFDDTYEPPSTTPSWAGVAEKPVGLDEENLAFNDYCDRVVTRF